jgi:hypothetical protein
MSTGDVVTTGSELSLAQLGQTLITATLILLHGDRPVTFVKGVRRFGFIGARQWSANSARY